MKTFIVQASLTIVTYDRKNMFIVQATGLHSKASLLASASNFRLGWKWLTMTNRQSGLKYGHLKFMIQAQEPM
jgi:hypothetical protein